MALGVSEVAVDVQNLAEDFNKLYLRSLDLFKTYWDRNLGSALPANGSDLVGGTALTKDNFISMITVVENFNKFMDGEVASQNTYRISCNKARAKS